MSSKRVFLIGPGFIGAELLELLVAGGYDVTTMVRRPEAKGPLEKLGAKVIIANLKDKETISVQVQESPVVIHTATADDLPSVEAVLDGVMKRAQSGKSTIYIHTSGCSLLTDDAKGEFKSETIFDDATADQIDALPDDAPHRQIDLELVKARAKLGNKAKIAIMLPPVVYGLGCRENRLSIQLPTLSRYAMKHGYAAHVGKGLPVWGQIHVADLANGYMAILQWLETDSCDSIYTNPYFFCENGDELSWKECAEEIGRTLHKLAKLPSAETKPIPEDLFKDIMGPWTEKVVGANARNRATRLRELGWSPQEKGTLTSLREDELPVIVQDTAAFNGYAKDVAS